MERLLLSQKITSSIKVGIGLIFVLVPLAVYPRLLYPLTTPKIILFQVLTELIFFLWLISIIFNNGRGVKITFLTGVVFASLSILSISAFLGLNVHRSFWDLIDRNTGLILLWHSFALFLVVKALKEQNHINIKWFAEINVVTGIVVSIIALIQYFIGWPSSLTVAPLTLAFAPFANTPFLAAYILIVFFLGWWLFGVYPEKKMKILMMTAIFLNLLVMLFTGNRAVIVGLIAGLVLLIFFHRKKIRETLNRKKNVGFAVLFLSITIFLTFFPLVQSTPSVKRFFSSSLQENFSQRAVFWDIAWSASKERPLLGWGWGNFDLAFWKHYNPEKYETKINYFFTRAPNKPFNVPLEYLVSGGILGLVSYLAIFAAIFYNLIRNKGPANIFLGAIFVAYFVNNLAIFETIATYPLFFGLLAFINERDVDKTVPISDTQNIGNVSKTKLYTILGIAALIGISLTHTINGRLAYASSEHYLAKQEIDGKGGFVSSLPHWQKAMKKFSPYLPQIQYDYIQETRRAFDQGVEYDKWTLIHQETITKLKNLVSLYPNGYDFIIELANTYNSFSKIADASYLEKADEAIRKAKTISPRNIAISFSLARNKILKRDREGALGQLKEAQKIHPGLSDPQILLAVLYFQAGDRQSSIVELNKALAQGMSPFYAEESIIFGDLNADIGDYEAAAQFYKRALTIPFIAPSRPKTFNTKLKLGLTYRLIGRQKTAEELFGELAEELLVFRDIDALYQLQDYVKYFRP